MHKGSCLCGAVTFEAGCALPGPDACYCTQCCRHSGHLWASSDVPRDARTIHGAEHLTWFCSSEKGSPGSATPASFASAFRWMAPGPAALARDEQRVLPAGSFGEREVVRWARAPRGSTPRGRP